MSSWNSLEYAQIKFVAPSLNYLVPKWFSFVPDCTITVHCWNAEIKVFLKKTEENVDVAILESFKRYFVIKLRWKFSECHFKSKTCPKLLFHWSPGQIRFMTSSLFATEQLAFPTWYLHHNFARIEYTKTLTSPKNPFLKTALFHRWNFVQPKLT